MKGRRKRNKIGMMGRYIVAGAPGGGGKFRWNFFKFFIYFFLGGGLVDKIKYLFRGIALSLEK